MPPVLTHVLRTRNYRNPGPNESGDFAAISGQGQNQEEGCVSCNFFQNTKEPLEFLLMEKWKSMENVKEHVASKNMAVLAGAGTILSHEFRVSLDKGDTVQELNREYMLRLSARDKDS